MNDRSNFKHMQAIWSGLKHKPETAFFASRSPDGDCGTMSHAFSSSPPNVSIWYCSYVAKYSSVAVSTRPKMIVSVFLTLTEMPQNLPRRTSAFPVQAGSVSMSMRSSPNTSEWRLVTGELGRMRNQYDDGESNAAATG